MTSVPMYHFRSVSKDYCVHLPAYDVCKMTVRRHFNIHPSFVCRRSCVDFGETQLHVTSVNGVDLDCHGFWHTHSEGRKTHLELCLVSVLLLHVTVPNWF